MAQPGERGVRRGNASCATGAPAIARLAPGEPKAAPVGSQRKENLVLTQRREIIERKDSVSINDLLEMQTNLAFCHNYHSDFKISDSLSN